MAAKPGRRCGPVAATTVAMAMVVLACVAGGALAQGPSCGQGVATSTCEGWQGLFDATRGNGWRVCRQNRDSPCECSGLTCSSSGAIEGITLDRGGLRGTLPSSLGLLTALQHLSLEFNEVEGPMHALGALTALTSLFMTECRMEGDLGVLGALTNLRALTMNHNNVRGSLDALAGLAQLTRLELNANKLNGPFFAFPDAAGLVMLDVSNNRVQGTLPSDLFATHTALQSFLAANNLLSGTIPAVCDHDNAKGVEGVEGVEGEGEGPPSGLNRLVLHDNNLDGTIPALAHCPLSTLTLHNNWLGGGVPVLPLGLFNHTAPDDGILTLHGNLLSCVLPAVDGVHYTPGRYKAITAFGNEFSKGSHGVPLWVSDSERSAEHLFVPPTPEYVWVLGFVASGAVVLAIAVLCVIRHPSHFLAPSLDALRQHLRGLHPHEGGTVTFQQYCLVATCIVAVPTSTTLLPLYRWGSGEFMCGEPMASVSISYLANNSTASWAVAVLVCVFTALSGACAVYLQRSARRIFSNRTLAWDNFGGGGGDDDDDDGDGDGDGGVGVGGSVGVGGGVAVSSTGGVVVVKKISFALKPRAAASLPSPTHPNPNPNPNTEGEGEGEGEGGGGDEEGGSSSSGRRDRASSASAASTPVTTRSKASSSLGSVRLFSRQHWRLLGWATRARLLGWTAVWAFSLVVLNIPTTLYIMLWSVPNNNTLGLSQRTMDFIEYSTVPLLVVISSAVIPLVCKLISRRVGALFPEDQRRVLRHEAELHLLVVSRLLVVIVLPMAMTVLLDDGCNQQWKLFWTPCAKGSDEYDIPRPDHAPGFMITTTELCERTYEADPCVRRVVQVTSRLIVRKLAIQAFFVPALLVVVYGVAWLRVRLPGTDEIGMQATVQAVGWLMVTATYGCVAPVVLPLVALVFALNYVVIKWITASNRAKECKEAKPPMRHLWGAFAIHCTLVCWFYAATEEPGMYLVLVVVPCVTAVVVALLLRRRRRGRATAVAQPLQQRLLD